MGGKEELRRYLEQRREAGERDLVLDGLSADEVMRLIGAKGSEPPAPRRVASDAPAAPQGDWRQVLRSAGAAPEKEPPPPPKRAAEPVPDLDEIPAGITIGSSERELFGGSQAEVFGSLEAIAKAVASCTKCALHSTALNPVPGEGNPNADFMVVGEAPGATEDETGRPFVGAAGKLLTDILAAIKLSREDVFICNVLKHRPPGNRDPLPDEVHACSPYLVRQVELIRPKVILALGKFAAQTLLNTTLALGKLREQVHRYYGVPLIVTFHPAALLRNPSWKKPTWKDVQLARRILDRALAQP